MTASDRTRTAIKADSRWQRVIDGDSSADGTFWYGVSTTGVFASHPVPPAGRIGRM